MATAPTFTGTPRLAVVRISTANTAIDGTGTIADLLTAGSSGSRIEHIDIKATVTTTAGMIRLFIYDGAAWRLWKEVSVTAVTPSASVQSFSTTLDLSTNDKVLVLPSGMKIGVATHNAETFDVAAVGGDF